MPQVIKGVYFLQDKTEVAYEAESIYYIDFYILSALYAIEKLRKYDGATNSTLSKFQYYHFYTDHVLFALGQISNRFVESEKNSELLKERKRRNCMNYGFSDDTFPLLSNKRARNVLEHIDEYDVETISEKGGVGGFNLIDENTEEEVLLALSDMRTMHLYTLNLVEGEIWIYDPKHNGNINLKLEELVEELNALRDNEMSFAKMVHSI